MQLQNALQYLTPKDEELPPTPVHLFPRRSEIAPENNDNENATDEAVEPVAACEYCLQARCITSSPFKPQGRSNARIIPITPNAARTTVGIGAL